MNAGFWRSPAVLRVCYVLLLVAVAVLLWSMRAGLLVIWQDHQLTFLGVGAIMSLGLLVQVMNFLQLLEWPRPLALRPAVHAWALATLLNYLGPFQPGLALRIAYFKSQGVPLARTAATTLRQLQLSVWTALAVCAVALVLLGGLSGWLGGGVLCLVFVVWPRILSALRPWFLGRRGPAWFVRHRESFDIVLTPLPFRSTRYFFLQHFLGGMLIFFSYRQLGASISVAHALLIAVGVYVSSFVALLPNNLGLLDAFYVATARSGGLDGTEAIALALLFRVAHVTVCLGAALVTSKPEESPK
jgi:Lysylphosphatidylglycerol synthase TM region